MNNTTTHLRRAAGALSAAALLVGALAACSSDSDAGQSPPVTVTATPEPGTVVETTTAVETSIVTPSDPTSSDPTGSDPMTSVAPPQTSEFPSLDPMTEGPIEQPIPTTSAGNSPDDDEICGATDYVDDRYHFMTSGHDFVQLCSAASGEDGAILSYVFEGTEMDTEEVEFDDSSDYTLQCGFSDQRPVCLVQAADTSGKSFHGELFVLTSAGELEEIEDGERTSTVEMALVDLPAADESIPGAQMLVEGVEFTELSPARASAPVGYRTATVDPAAVTVSGCTQAFTTGYPDLPTTPATGSCGADAEVVDG